MRFDRTEQPEHRIFARQQPVEIAGGVEESTARIRQPIYSPTTHMQLDLNPHQLIMPVGAPSTSDAGMQVALVALIVDEYDPAIEFFTGILGFDLVEDSPSLTSDGRPKRWVVVRPPGAQTGILLARADGEHQTEENEAGHRARKPREMSATTVPRNNNHDSADEFTVRRSVNNAGLE